MAKWKKTKGRFKLVGLRWEAPHESKENVIPKPDQEEVICVDTSTDKVKKDLISALERYGIHPDIKISGDAYEFDLTENELKKIYAKEEIEKGLNGYG